MARNENQKSGITEKIRLIIFVCEIITTFVIPTVFALWDQITLGIGIAILAANISVLFLLSQFMENQLLSEMQEKLESHLSEIQERQETHYSKLENSINEVGRSVDIDELYKKIYMLENTEQKDIYLELVQTFVETMDNRMRGARSGALSRHAYYGELTKASEAIISDKQKVSSDVYQGEIWAMTFWQDDELDLSDDYENAWVRKMEAMDNMGIATVRLCVMKNKKNLLVRDSIDDSVETFLKRLKYYCEKNAVCKNTTVYAIDSIDTLSAREQEWIGKGFFAIKLANGDMRLIRGVSLDNRNATTLGGEIDFDNRRVAMIRDVWEKLIEESGRRGINQYLWDMASESVKAKMVGMGFDVNND